MLIEKDLQENMKQEPYGERDTIKNQQRSEALGKVIKKVSYPRKTHLENKAKKIIEGAKQD